MNDETKGMKDDGPHDNGDAQTVPFDPLDDEIGPCPHRDRSQGRWLHRPVGGRRGNHGRVSSWPTRDASSAAESSPDDWISIIAGSPALSRLPSFDTVAQMRDDGVRRALAFVTSAYGGYSSCRQYQEDIARARDHVENAPAMIRLRQFYDHPLFVERFATDLRAALDAAAPGARVVFTAHSVPDAADAVAGPPELGGHLYSRQVQEASRLVADAVGVREYDVVWQSRSGPPSVPWLEPDVVDHVTALATGQGVTDVVVVPIGFISDHVEVIWDLDTELVDEVRDLGVTVTRCATPGPSREFARMIVELLDEAESGVIQSRPGCVPSLGMNRDGARCAVGCCSR